MTGDEIRDWLQRLADTLENQSDAAALQAAALIAERAKELAPVRTGALRDSIEASSDGEQAVVTVGVEYAKFVELGTFRTPPQPFLLPAIQEEQGLLEKAAETLKPGE